MYRLFALSVAAFALVGATAASAQTYRSAHSTAVMQRDYQAPGYRAFAYVPPRSGFPDEASRFQYANPYACTEDLGYGRTYPCNSGD